MSSIWGNSIRVSVFGESHGPGIGVVVDGFPAGVPLDLDRVAEFMKRRAPGRTPWSTARREEDLPEILSGIYRGHTTGSPICALIRNTDVHSGDYAAIDTLPRPGHADYTGSLRYGGFNDPRGGGHFSGRLTAPLTFAGAICLQWLSREGIRIYAHAARIGGVDDLPVDLVDPDESALAAVAAKRMPVISDAAGEAMAGVVETARMSLDSVGGIVECLALDVPAGLGDPMFLGLEGRFSSLLFSIPAVKGVSFGDGFSVSDAQGSTNNDRPSMAGGSVRMRSNHSGGIDGGIANGMPIVVRVAFKPTPSIAQKQETVDLSSREDAEISISGRHDPCIVPRAVPVVEACIALAIADAMKEPRTMDDPRPRLLLLNGPNLDMLGRRNKSHYGDFTLADAVAAARETADGFGYDLDDFQSNYEGALIEAIHAAMGVHRGIVINAGAFTHYSYALRDAIELCGLPVLEVHISDIHMREEWRHVSVIQPACAGQIAGLGMASYTEGVRRLCGILSAAASAPGKEPQ